ncbi:HetP family heterocyst commitment protein [Calothrix sp. FACHB-1219]|uniref:HetP family heterocyst commitment protein n=1 Tax=unclassified Calothrix TaxID=2619626 RepID=UPI0016856E4C|nr:MULTISPECIES: HetP family heterocyst commitment protein [unclassified Calothrix]MBD2203769.1 HetP family heterocyst commitment protein [Calothrix sp. FACHB-168]MBD2219589.1 HetP family heterocyst commitment protein [Calothrix sp. FACHB-1219]
MSYQVSSQPKNYQKAISSEQLNQVIEAITEGRYSWACVLLLRFVGYNPLHFIPQRTYSRLIKENSQPQSTIVSTTNRSLSANLSSNNGGSQGLNKIHDLDYLETSDKKQASLKGGNNLLLFPEAVNQNLITHSRDSLK